MHGDFSNPYLQLGLNNLLASLDYPCRSLAGFGSLAVLWKFTEADDHPGAAVYRSSHGNRDARLMNTQASLSTAVPMGTRDARLMNTVLKAPLSGTEALFWKKKQFWFELHCWSFRGNVDFGWSVVFGW